MRKVKILTDSCADLNAELLGKYDIDYLRMVTVLDGVETPAELTWSEQETEKFYEDMRSGKRFTTAQVSSAEFERGFTHYLNEGYDIVYIACSSKQSGSVNTGSVMAEKILKNYPDAQIFCIDSLNASLGEGMLAIEAAKLADEGRNAAEISERITAIRKNVREYVTVHTLDFLKRAGRVTGPSAFFGNLMGVKPIIVSDINGTQAAFKKVKGRQNSIKELVSLTKSSIKDPENQTVYIVHSAAPKDEVDELCRIAGEELGCKDICVAYIGPIIGASIGPDSLGIFTFGEEETFSATN